MKYVQEFEEIVKWVVRNMKSHLLRTSLSLLGVSIGIFTVIGILSAVDGLQNYLINSLNRFGNNTLFIDRFDYNRMGRMTPSERKSKKPPTYEEYKFLLHQIDTTLVKAMGYRMVLPSVAVRAGDKSINVRVQGETFRVHQILQFELKKGRFFTPYESEKGMPVAVIGKNVEEVLFPGGHALNQYITMYGKKIKVIGVYRGEGGAIRISPMDNAISVPYEFLRKIVPERPGFAFVNIVIAPSGEARLEELKDQLIMILRKYRKLKPGQPNTFYVNNISFLRDMVSKSIKNLYLAGWILGGFSLLVGAFGIANIMFVSVKERTREIGIQKALGARRRWILTEFILESVFLSLLGGIIGLAMIFIALKVLKKIDALENLPIELSWQNIFIALFVSVAVGIIAGYWPSRQAALLDPIKAIRKGE